MHFMKSVDKIQNRDVTIQAPASKAHTLRALIISSLTDGASTICNPLLGQDQFNVLECLKNLGVKIETQKDKITVHGMAGKYSPISETLNVGESGVGMNFLISAANLIDKPVILTGAKRITERPIFEVVDGMRQLGCKIEYVEKEGFPPIKIYGVGIEGGTAKIRGAKTSQYFSSIVISSPYAQNPVTLKCVDQMTEKPYFDISLHMMSQFGVKAENNNYKEIKIPNAKYTAREIKVEGDYSSASFFFWRRQSAKQKSLSPAWLLIQNKATRLSSV
jgi:3-phosphoshikimate 1-carboxyvinyltransferase